MTPPAAVSPAAQTFFASVPRHLESYLAAELQGLGATSVKPVASGVEFIGDLATAYKACLWSRVANRILMPVAIGAASSPEQLYEFIQTIDWSLHLDSTQTLAVDFFCSNSVITHSQYGALKVKDAVVDQFRTATGVRPSVDRQQPDVRINVYLFRNRARVSIDLSGTSLHRRGYRADGSLAPLKENLAAALLLAADWPKIASSGASFYDPMCGSGTLLIEAALIASNTAPGIYRDYFGFLGWKGHKPDDWNKVRTDAVSQSEQGRAQMPAIVGADHLLDVVDVARGNIIHAGFSDHIVVQHIDIDSLVVEPALKPGLLLTNPPYGVRLEKQAALGKLYTALGKLLQREFSQWQVAVFTGAPGLVHRFRSPLKAILDVANGDLDCKLMGRLAVTQATNQATNQIASPDTPMPPAVAQAEQRSDVTAQALAADNMFANRLRKNAKNLRSWIKKESITAWRVYDADMPEYAVAVDIYDTPQRHVVVQEYQAPSRVSETKAAERLNLIMNTIPEVLQCASENVHLKVRKRQKGADQYQREAVRRREFTVIEGQSHLLVNFEDYLDTGLFLDHRKVRQYIQNESDGKRFLNLFAYTGSATVHAAMGGATSTLTLDMSNTYLDWAQRNLELNRLETGTAHRLERVDCVEWLNATGSAEAGVAPGAQFDLILLDPPTFSNSARMESDWDVQRDHAALLRQAMSLLAAGGVMIFSNNFRRFKLDNDLSAEFDLENRGSWSLDRDFQRNPKIHHCWFFRHRI